MTLVYFDIYIMFQYFQKLYNFFIENQCNNLQIKIREELKKENKEENKKCISQKNNKYCQMLDICFHKSKQK